MNQPCTEQTIRDNEQLAELDMMYKETERALVLIGDRMREIKNRLQKKPPVGGEFNIGTIMPSEYPRDINLNIGGIDWYQMEKAVASFSKLAGGKYEK